jgi:hypothetical protein
MPIDPYAPNPLADEVRERDPFRYEQVAAVKEPPKLFAGGTSDIPAFTASGIDPQHLLKLPAGIRHAAAANPDIVQVHKWFEDYAGFPEMEIDHPGLRDAKLRMEDWLTNTDTDPRSEEQRAADDAELYAQFYGADNDRVTHAVEQKRREQAGEDPLPSYQEIQIQKNWERNQAVAVAQAEAPPVDPAVAAVIQNLAELARGGAK